MLADTAPRTRWRSLAAAALLVAGVSGCGSEQLQVAPQAPSATTAQSAPDIVQTARPLENIRNLDLRSTILMDVNVPERLRETIEQCRLCGLGDPIYTDLTKDRIDDVLVPIVGENGTAGDIAYTVRDSKPVLLLAYSGSFGGVTVAPNGDLVLTEQLYGPNDAACCATGPKRVRVFTWNGRKMVLRSTAGDKKGYTPYDSDTKLVT